MQEQRDTHRCGRRGIADPIQVLKARRVAILWDIRAVLQIEYNAFQLPFQW